MSCSASGLGISFIRNQDGLLLNLDSTKWKLERGNAYTVRLAAGSQSVDAKALAETKGVTIAFADRSFNENLGKHMFLKSEERATRFASRWTGALWRSTVLKRASRKMVARAERLIRSSRLVGVVTVAGRAGAIQSPYPADSWDRVDLGPGLEMPTRCPAFLARTLYPIGGTPVSSTNPIEHPACARGKLRNRHRPTAFMRIRSLS